MIKDEKLLEKYNEIWKKVSNIMKKEFGSKPKYNEKYVKTKVKIKTDFNNKKILKYQKKAPNVFVYK